MSLSLSPQDMARRLGSGLLSFPVTPFTADFAIDEAQYRSNMDWLCGYDVAGLFAAGGTGEFFSLTPAEVARVVGIAVAETNGRVPVLAGVGYGTAIACEMAVAAEKAGADGLLLLPPYLVGSEQDGLSAHIEAVCRATSLGVIVYNRDNAVIGPDALARLCERCPNLVGYKDGIGDIELMTRIYSRIGDRLTYIGGLPTAETFALPYLEMGVTTYSSAVFNFVPDFALSFYAAVRRRDRDAVAKGLKEFILPLIEIRNRRRGYAVSIIKAGMKAVGRDSGPVRSPLTDLTAAEQAEVSALVARIGAGAGQRLAAAE
ncbi:5-dehydro-4-deoxyglucarate dehydratase [Methylobacterium oryzihabitans]|uniref:Probable 5-dehydro-4-deoxyglucarate dehydratase n=1 Tax=Methylobacterium oryzihabitans TaxID=2499852 RepID=A0A3S2XKS0_9HYPH|nr:5-dehydro-4-deoxyglucarate dehydratase [Methylobacterium oryzihabitans]RVU17213.1 5-dehydro-4-deoxyglucarate dehydratase [Methylobacterium oryzihabitans]